MYNIYTLYVRCMYYRNTIIMLNIAIKVVDIYISISLIVFYYLLPLLGEFFTLKSIVIYIYIYLCMNIFRKIAYGLYFT